MRGGSGASGSTFVIGGGRDRRSVLGENFMTDTLFADVSTFQAPVDDDYPYEVLSFRSNDGTFRDDHFAHNYRWATAAADSGRLACFIVYFYWRPNWQETVR